ncbi:photosynthetic complex assembly protein PuhC [Falsiroseomonas ponticola]|jgi:putative photosynthetic complex assembly protein|uniref:photosynthetic complex assembly protein PuhC n=1 Tax=Falsiroseomonas ponticola TaxID=2786951 RepID=UPI001932F978|nr:photosynthetic complex assembly protein PuhC [Roseomonas ponticola]
MAQAIRHPLSGKGPLLAAALLIAATLALTTAPPPGGGVQYQGEVSAQRELLFADRADGGVTVTDARTGQAIGELAPGEDGFIRGALRGLVRERRIGGLGPEAPFRLTGWSDGRLTLEDPATGTRLDLAAYGATNAEAFARFLSTKENQR